VALTRQLLAFSRRQVLTPRVLDLNALVTQVAGMLRRVIGEHIQLVTVLAPTLAPVRADAGQLEQVLLNLAVNARDAMPDGGRLTIEIASLLLDERAVRGTPEMRQGRYVCLSVSDTGVGMDEATKSRIFEPFFTTKEVGKGTGLGLATVYGIVKQMGGHILVDSEPGRGAVFRVYLPPAGEWASGEAGGPSAAGAPRGSETILLVEDEVAVRAVTRRLLERQGYRVVAAANGTEALRLGTESAERIHLLITDVVMPELGGFGLAEQLASRDPALKVLYMSGHADDTVVRRGELPPGIAFLQKPFTAEALAQKVRSVLD
jgi:CheY-like chemotaxis protein